MKSIYIAGKITGTTDYMERFARAEKWLSINRKEYCVVNPAKTNALLSEKTPYADYIHIGLALLRTCDTIFMLNGWKDSAGATLEHQYTKTLGYDILYEEDHTAAVKDCTEAANESEITSELLIHPGETLADLLKEKGFTPSIFADWSCLSPTYIIDVISGKADISTELASALEKIFHTPQSFWLNLQARYNDERMLEKNESQKSKDD